MSTILTSAPAGPRALGVLIIDDSEADVEVLRRLLARALGAAPRVVDFDTAAAALAAAARESFDVALVDYRLPDMDGLELVSRLAAVCPSLPIVLLTGQGSERIAAQAIKRGAHDYLIKRDLDAGSLGTAIEEAIGAARERDRNRGLVHQLQQSNSELDHAVRSLSHDMSANFMVLENSFEQIKKSCDGPLGPNLIHGVTHVEACLRESKRFLDDMSLLWKTGSVATQPSRVEMSAVVHDVLFELEDLLAERRIEVRIAEPLPAVWCNATRAAQLVSNLVRNAIKHGCDPISPRLEISSPSEAARPLPPNRVWLRIHDNGRGIAAHDREEIFLPGRRLPSAHADGSGMGLAIVRKIVERSGGVIFVDPQTTSGTAFIVSLPKPPPAEGQPAAPHFSRG